MTFLLVLVLVVFFIGGYQLHRYQSKEKEEEFIKLFKQAEKLQKEAMERKEHYIQEQQKLNEQICSLHANNEARTKHFASVQAERDALSTAFFLMKRNCSCAANKQGEGQ